MSQVQELIDWAREENDKHNFKKVDRMIKVITRMINVKKLSILRIKSLGWLG